MSAPTAAEVLKAFEQRIEAFRTEVGAVRDKGRELFGELEALIESLTEAGDAVDTAVLHARNAIELIDGANDKLSEYA